MTDNYRVVASTQTRDPYPVLKYFEDPKEWTGTGTVKISCKDGRVDVTIMEKDSIRTQHATVYSADGPVKTVITEQFEHPA